MRIGQSWLLVIALTLLGADVGSTDGATKAD